jgi:hypothetical protein
MPEPVAFDAELLDANLRAMEVGSPQAARRIRSAGEAAGVEFVRAADGGLAALYRCGTDVLQMSSLISPIDEGRSLAESVDYTTTGAVFVVGFGVGHHIRAMAERLRRTGVLFVFEPDIALLRSVLGRVDCRGWLGATNLVLVLAPDSGSVSREVQGYEGVIASGTKVVEHPASRRRLGRASGEFLATLASAIGSIRTHVVTALCQVTTTMSNLAHNAWAYAKAEGIAELKGAASGRPAVVVSAGPSLARNIEELSKPGVRDKVVIIAAQTVLKTLLARGIRPHFVTALDYSEVSARFYEGLTAGDVEGITLVAEPKANPAILRAFPGVVRCPAEPILDEVLGEGFRRDMGEIRSGATVAHLSYYLARHMGCDPVVLVGQDLGFTDGQYYSAGAAIHQVWSGELNEFNTLEMMEWQRIARMRGILHRAKDHLGRNVYTDEQMRTYRVQFERDFAEDAERGLTVIDATEGGVRKEGTRLSTLRDAIESFPTIGPWSAPARARRADEPSRARAVRERIEAVRADAVRVGELAGQAASLMSEMLRLHGNHDKVNRLIMRAHELAHKAASLKPAYGLVQHINQTGTLRRYKADRAIHMTEGMTDLERQRRQMERDKSNVEWLRDAAEELAGIFGRALAAESGKPAAKTKVSPHSAALPMASARVRACVAVDFGRGGLWTPRDLGATIAGRTILEATVGRLLRSIELDGVAVLASDVERARVLLGSSAADPRVEIIGTPDSPWRNRGASVGAARLWSRSCWRGGVGGMSIYDEAFAPGPMAKYAGERGLDALVVVGADWCLVDPQLIDEMVRRYRRGGADGGAGQKFLFVQSAPGLGACLLDRSVVDDVARSASKAGPLSSLGALLGYLPMAAQPDPIGKPACVSAGPAARDLGVRCIPDSPERRRMISEAMGASVHTAGALEVASRVGDWVRAHGRRCLETITIETTDARGGRVDVDGVLGLVAAACAGRPDVAVTLRGDPWSHHGWMQLCRGLRERGAAGVHVRTFLRGGAEEAKLLRSAGVDVVSVDVLTTDERAYEALTGVDAHRTVIEGMMTLLRERVSGTEGLVDLWVVPRMTRRDHEYERLELFYDSWLTLAGAAVIDPLPAAIEGERIAPLPVPGCVRERRERSEVVVRADGSAWTPGGVRVELAQVRAIELEAKGLAPAEAA